MIPRLDRFAWIALLFCCFSLCTTRPIGPIEYADAGHVGAPDTTSSIDALFDKIHDAEVASDSLSNALSRSVSVRNSPRQTVIKSEREIWTGPYRDSTGPFNFEINSHQNNNNNE